MVITVFISFDFDYIPLFSYFSCLCKFLSPILHNQMLYRLRIWWRNWLKLRQNFIHRIEHSRVQNFKNFVNQSLWSETDDNSWEWPDLMILQLCFCKLNYPLWSNVFQLEHYYLHFFCLKRVQKLIPNSFNWDCQIKGTPILLEPFLSDIWMTFVVAFIYQAVILR